MPRITSAIWKAVFSGGIRRIACDRERLQDPVVAHKKNIILYSVIGKVRKAEMGKTNPANQFPNRGNFYAPIAHRRCRNSRQLILILHAATYP
jgi:hypothetical protein